MIRKIARKIHSRYSMNFLRYLAVGIVFTLLNIFCMWMVIDLLGISTVVGSALVVTVMFLGKYYAYVLLGLIYKKFARYLAVGIIFPVANVFLMWFFVDMIGISTALGAAISVYLLFLLRFFAYDLVKLMKHKGMA
ncbi:hypothetical protein GF351_05795 [Candidatus Woesearchaeota archaeon]|nr:hypothetical protein [Candidatus Woesearchaeota archaeon]